MLLRLALKWFMIGFIGRLVVGIAIAVLINRSLEASMLYLADVPTIFVISLFERLSPRTALIVTASRHPYYIAMNLLGSVVWGSLFALVRCTIAAMGSRRSRLSSGP